MGVIELCNISSISIVRAKPSSLNEGNRRRRIACMASSVSVQEEESHQQKQGVNGGSFIRTHLLKLSPYQPILPFEVSIWDPFLISCCIGGLHLVLFHLLVKGVYKFYISIYI